MDHDTNRITAQLMALGYMPPGVGVQRPFWDEYGVAVSVGLVVLFLYVSLVAALGQETERLPGDGDRNR